MSITLVRLVEWPLTACTTANHSAAMKQCFKQVEGGRGLGPISWEPVIPSSQGLPY